MLRDIPAHPVGGRETVDMVGRTRTSIVLALAVLLLAGAVGVGLTLFRAERAVGESAAQATWDDFRVVRRVLEIHGTRSSCQDVTAVDVVETDRRVEVTLGLTGNSSACNEPAVALKRRVRLAAPLGDRPVYDGGCLAEGGSDGECWREELDLATG